MRLTKSHRGMLVLFMATVLLSRSWTNYSLQLSFRVYEAGRILSVRITNRPSTFSSTNPVFLSCTHRGQFYTPTLGLIPGKDEMDKFHEASSQELTKGSRYSSPRNSGNDEFRCEICHKTYSRRMFISYSTGRRQVCV